MTHDEIKQLLKEAELFQRRFKLRYKDGKKGSKVYSYAQLRGIYDREVRILHKPNKNEFRTIPFHEIDSVELLP